MAVGYWRSVSSDLDEKANGGDAFRFHGDQAMNYFVFHIYMIGSYSPSRLEAWEENLRVYQDATAELAEARARRDAVAVQSEYETSDGYHLSWRLHSLRLVNVLPSHGLDGEEIFSRSLTHDEAQSLMKKIG